MSDSIEQLLGISSPQAAGEQNSTGVSFSFLFFSDVRKDVSDAQKYQFMRDITLFADREGFTAVYIPERHFHEFGSIYANSAVMAAYLIPQTERLRFRTAGVSVPLHHPAEIVEWWAMNDVLSGGRIDLGFGSGWNKADFIVSPDTYADRRQVCKDHIPIIQRLWRGESVCFPGPGGEDIPITVYPRPVQKELNVWFLAARSDESFSYAGRQGYNLFTMLYGINLKAMEKKIAIYRKGREAGGHDPETGIVSLMLHTLVHKDRKTVEEAVEQPFKEYIRSSLNAHVKSAPTAMKDRGAEELGREEKEKMLDYAYQRYYKTGAIFGTVEDGREVVEEAIRIGVNDIACLLDFGVDYDLARDTLPYLKRLIAPYL